MDEYQSESSTVMKFMYQMNYLCRYEEIADIEPKWMSSAILYRKYCKWCRDNNAKEENVTVFGRILSEAGYRKKRTPNGQVYGLYGTALTENSIMRNGKTYGVTISKGSLNRFINMANDTLIPMKGLRPACH